jgi:hypothetical protein
MGVCLKVAKHLLRKCEAQSSTPSATKKEKNKNICWDKMYLS